MKFRKHFDYDVEKASDEAAVHTVGESMTVQSMAEDADLNVIVRRFGLTGKMPENPRVPIYADFTGVTDYQSALNVVIEANEAFMELPASVRARFENNPQKLLEFCENDANIEEARKLGLLKENVDGSVTGTRGSGPGQQAAGGPSAEAGGAQSVDAAGHAAKPSGSSAAPGGR